MLLLSGKLFNIFTTDRRKTKSGDEFGGDDKVQILTTVALENGTSKSELVDLKVNDAALFRGKEMRDVQIPVGVFAPAKGSVVFFMSGKPIFNASTPLQVKTG
jgi:hypothetical protein